jgi:hypothetical protein
MAKVDFGTGRHRLCGATKRNGETCRRIALKGVACCGCHGGYAQLACKGLYKKTPRPPPKWRAELV